MMRPVRVTAPAVPLVTLSEAKAQARVEHSDEDTLISGLISAATAHLDGWSGVLGRCLVNQTWRQDVDAWGETLRLPFPDVSSVTLTYRDADDAEQTVAAAGYELLEDERGAYLAWRDAFARPSVSGDRAAPISVEMVAGYGAAASDVPQAIRHAALLLVSHLYEHREAVMAGVSLAVTPLAVASLIDPYRRARI